MKRKKERKKERKTRCNCCHGKDQSDVSNTHVNVT